MRFFIFVEIAKPANAGHHRRALAIDDEMPAGYAAGSCRCWAARLEAELLAIAIAYL
jgi:hypothetical protein